MPSEIFPHLRRSFENQIDLVEAVDVRVPEDSALIGLASDLVPKVTHLLRSGIELMRSVEKGYASPREEMGRSEGVDTLHHIGMMISAEFASRDLIDVAYFARVELGNALELLESAATRSDRHSLLLASACESGLHCMRKALVSVESAVFEYEGEPPPTRQWFDVELSLQIRKLYWNLRHETESAVNDDARDLEVQLRKVLYRIVAFRELSVYPFLRVDDRVHMRSLMKRILEWLNSDRREIEKAENLWRDLVSFTELLVQVSHRQELQDHDRELLRRTHGRLFQRNDLEEMPARLLTKLENLLGLDQELDDLIANRITFKEAWREPLENLLARLEKAPMPPARVDLLGSLDET